MVFEMAARALLLSLWATAHAQSQCASNAPSIYGEKVTTIDGKPLNRM
jgi:hypothetical protein